MLLLPGPRTPRRHAPEPKPRPRLGDPYRGVLPSGRIGRIEPVGGGYYDRNGRYIPEMFPPDPYKVGNAVMGFGHYSEGSGKPRNVYLNTIDLKKLSVTDFPEMRVLLLNGEPGSFPIVESQGSYDLYDHKDIYNFSMANTVGGLRPVANGRLLITKSGRYSFDGRLYSLLDSYDFDKRIGQSSYGAFANRVGRHLRGTNYFNYIIGTVPFSRKGRTSEGRVRG